MILNSFTFLVFFVIFFLIYFISSPKLRFWWLLAASVVFYLFAGLTGFIVLFGLSVFNYYTGIAIGKAENKNTPLLIACIGNLSALFIFKYLNFFGDSINSIFHLANIEMTIPFVHLIMPLGISYFILQAIGYNIDIQREMAEPETNFPVFLSYFLFFPKAVQGPVDRPRLLLPQLHKTHDFDYNRVKNGLYLIGWGLFKKLVIADRLGVIVNQVYGNTEQYSGYVLLVAGFFYTFQLYADFSGYMDMAVGVSEILGFTIFKNFNKPFAATSVTDFWKRWHISLSTWLYEYVFNPISLLKRDWGIWGMVYAIFITFFLSGLWHGASWVFIMWGILNGFALGYELKTAKWRKSFFKKMDPKVAKVMMISLTFIFTILSFTFARANTLSDAWYMLTHIFDSSKQVSLLSLGLNEMNMTIALAGIALLLALHWSNSKTEYRLTLNQQPTLVRWMVYCISILVILNFGILAGSGFIYAQF